MGQPTSKPKTILIVEDDEVAREGLAFILQREAYQTATATNGKEGMDYLLEHPLPDLVLLDMLMGQHDGWYFLSAWKANPTLRGVPILLMTIGVTTRDWAMAHGCAGFIPKPINVPNLLTEIQRVLSLQRS